jgi:hypothetical protein
MLKMATGITVQQYRECYVGMLTLRPGTLYYHIIWELQLPSSKDIRNYATQGTRSMAQQRLKLSMRTMTIPV